MKLLKKFFLAILIFLFVVIIALVAAPFLFKDELIKRTKASIGDQINATVDFDDVSLSLLRSFPKACIALEKLTIDGKGEFEGIRLAAIDEVQLDFDVLSLIQKGRPIELNQFRLYKPNVILYTGRDSVSNFDIFKTGQTTSTDTTSSPITIDLQSYKIENGSITYVDRLSDMQFELPSFTHEGRLQYSGDIVDIVTETQFDSIYWSQNGILYLNRPEGTLNLTMVANLDKSTYAIEESKLRINALHVEASGEVEQLGNAWALDLSFKAPGNQFDQLLSLIPGAYRSDFDQVNTEGNFSLSGLIKGTYNQQTDTYPSFDIHLEVSNGQFKYPDLAYAMTDIQFVCDIKQPGNSLNQTVISVKPLRFEVDDAPFSASVLVRDPLTDIMADVELNGTLNLEKIGKTLPLESIAFNRGIIQADVRFKGRKSDIKNKAYNQVQANGQIEAKNINIAPVNYPDVQIDKATIRFTPQAVDLEETVILAGQSDLALNGRIDNILALFTKDRLISGNLNLQSRMINLNEWQTDESTEQDITEDQVVNTQKPVFEQYGLQWNLDANEILYEDYLFKNTTAKGWLQEGDLAVSEGRSNLRGNTLQVSGNLSGLVDYLLAEDKLRGEINLSSPRINLNDFMDDGEETTGSQTNGTYAAIEIPSDLDLVIHTNVSNCKYANWNINNVKGVLALNNGTLQMRDITGKTLGGDMLVSGTYKTKDVQKPAFDLKYELTNLSFHETFLNIKMFEQLAPVGKFIEGRLTNSMILSGQLGPDLLPDWKTFNAAGVIETFSAEFDQINAFERMGKLLKLAAFSDIPLQNTKNWFEVKNGVLEINPIEIKHNDLFLTVSGKHSITQNLDYKVRVKVPRSKIEQSDIGQTATSLWNKVNREASNLGVDLDAGNFLVFDFNITGAIKEPDIQMKFVGTSEGPGDQVKADKQVTDQVKDKLKEEVEGKVEATKKKVKDTLKEITEKARDSLKGLAEKKLEEAGQDVKEKIDEATDKAGKELQDSLKEKLGDTGKEKVDEIKDKLGKWDPFKKKGKEKDKDN